MPEMSLNLQDGTDIAGAAQAELSTKQSHASEVGSKQHVWAVHEVPVKTGEPRRQLHCALTSTDVGSSEHPQPTQLQMSPSSRQIQSAGKSSCEQCVVVAE